MMRSGVSRAHTQRHARNLRNHRVANLGVGTLNAAAALITLLLGAINPNYVNFEKPHVHPMDLSPSGAVLAVCNTADNRVELFDVARRRPVNIGSIPVGYDPVSVRFLNETELWAVNQISDTVSVIDLTAGVVAATLQTADEPADVVFANGRAFISCSQANLVQVFDLSNLSAPPVEVPIIGEDPRALGVSADGGKVYAALFEAGNGTTIIGGGADGTDTISFPPNDAITDPENPYGGLFNGQAPNDGLGFDPPINPMNRPAPRTGLIVRQQPDGRWLDDNGADWSAYIDGEKAELSGRFPGWKLLSYDVVAVDTETLEAAPVAEEVTQMNSAMALAVRPDGAVTIVGSDAINEVRYEPVLNGRFLRVQMGFLNGPDGPNPVIDLNAGHLANAQLEEHGIAEPYFDGQVNASARFQSIGDPRAIVWTGDGSTGYVAGMGSNNVIAVDAGGQRIAGLDARRVPEGPTGLVLDESRGYLYVLSRFAGRLTVIDTQLWRRVASVPFYDPTPQEIKTGRKHLFDTHRNSGLGMVSCASCHIDGRMDRLAWDLGDPAGEMQRLGDVLTGFPSDAELFINRGAGVSIAAAGIETSLHPMKGPMTTQTFQGIIGTEPLHWRGDRAGIEEFNPAFTNLQGAERQLTPEEMREFRDYLATIHFPPNPFRGLDNSLPADLPLPGQYTSGLFAPEGQPMPNGNAQRGLELYRGSGSQFGRRLDGNAISCVQCHSLPTGAGTNTVLNGSVFEEIPLDDMGNAHLAVVSIDGSTQRHFKVAQLRNQYDKLGFVSSPGKVSTHGFGVLHDGSVDTVARFLSEEAFEVRNDQEVADLTALVMAFAGSEFPGPEGLLEPPGVASADAHAGVGAQFTFDSAAEVTDDALLVLAEADEGSLDIVLKLLIDGAVRGGVYDAGEFVLDDAAGTRVDTSGVFDLAGRESPVTFMAVPRGLGIRMGIDRDEDGVPDFAERQAGSDTATIRVRVDERGGRLERQRAVWEVPTGAVTAPEVLSLEWTAADLSAIDPMATGAAPVAVYEPYLLGGAARLSPVLPMTLSFSIDDADEDGILDDSDVPLAALGLIVYEENSGAVAVLKGEVMTDDAVVQAEWLPESAPKQDARYVLALAEIDTAAPGLIADVDNSGAVDAVDVQLVINGALGISAGVDTDIDNNTVTDAVDVQLVINGALGIS